MAIEKNRIKTSLFLALLMILTPLAAASTVTTFSDGSSEVVIEFKDGYSLTNTTDGGFYLGSGETITSATVNISSEPLLHHTSNGYAGIQSFSWDSNINNGATTFDNVSKFAFNKDTLQNSVQFHSELLVTDFESNDGGFDNSTQNYEPSGKPIAWDYAAIEDRQLSEGPDTCASGEMCWGTNIFDDDYTNDLDTDPAPYVDQIEFRLSTPVMYLDSGLNDTFLRFSSWHQMETKFNINGDYYYDDCAFIEIEYSQVGQFTGEQQVETLLINFPESSGVGPGEGLYAKDDSGSNRDRISPECSPLDDNAFGLAGTSINPQNQDGWATIASNLAPYLSNYVKINFVLFHTDAPGNTAQFPTPGWYIDDVTIGEKYVTDGTMVIENLQFPQTYNDKSPNGYGLLFLDTFEPADSSLSYTFRDAISGQVATDQDGNPFQGLTGQVIELWDLDATDYPYIDLEVRFNSGNDQISTPVFFGYSFGTEFGITFNDVSRHRGLDIDDGEFDYVHDKGYEMHIDSASFIDTNNGEFSKPIYGLTVSGMRNCQIDMELDSPLFTSPQPIYVETAESFASPLFEFSLKLTYNADCVMSDIWIEVTFGHHATGIGVDYGVDQINEWEFNQPGYGNFGMQNMFYSGELNGVSQGSKTARLSLDPITGLVIDGFFLIPKGANLDYFDVAFVNNDIFNANNTDQGFALSIVVGATSEYVELAANEDDFNLYDIGTDKQKAQDVLQDFISDPNVPVIKTDSSGIEWVRVGFQVVQLDSNNGGAVELENLKVIYRLEHQIGQDGGFAAYLREFVATSNQGASQSSGAQTLVPVETTSANGGKITLSNLTITSQAGYDSTLVWNSQYDGLYATGELYHITTTHSVDPITGASLSACKITFKTDEGAFSLVYDLLTGWSEEGDSQDYVTLHPSSTASIVSGDQQIDWKFSVNSNWDDQARVIILSETVADDGVVGMLSGISILPATGNAVENDIRISDFTLSNFAGVEQQLTQAYSNQDINLKGNLTFESVSAAPDPASYFLVVEKRGLEIDGEFTNITWTEIANRSGAIGGYYDWNVNLGLFASGLETFRFRAAGYDGGDTLCPPAEYNPDSDCGIQFNLSIDILNPNLLSFELYKRNSGEGDVNSDENWRTVFDDSWATPKILQDFRLTISDIPTPPESAVLHVWVQYDHDANSNGLAEESEYIQVATTSNGAAPNATFIGTYNDFANSGLKGKVSVWIESYDLAGNPVDGGGGPGFDNDYLTYVGMDLEYPTIKSLNIEDSNGVRMLSNIPANAPDGVGIWNQTMFAGNQYNLIVEAEDGNGWKDVEMLEIVLAPEETNYDSTIIYYPRNQTALTTSDLFSIAVDSSGDSLATIRTLDGNVLIDPFEPEFIINIPINFEWGLPLSGQYTPSFQIKDLDNSPVFSESSYRQTWTYQNDMRLDFRSNLDEKRMISPTLTDQNIPISDNLYHEIGQETFIGSVTGGDVVMFSGQYSFTSGILENVFITPEAELTMEITRKEVFRDSERDYDPVEEEVTTHTFTGGVFDIPIKMPSYQNEFEYEFKLINLPVGAEDLTTAYCFGSVINGCGKFVIKVDDEAPKLVFGSWSASRGETASNGLEPELLDKMPTSSYHCVDVSSQIEERGSLAEDATTLNWIYYNGNPQDGNVWNVYQNNYGTTPLSAPLNLSAGSLGYIRASAECVDLWPVGFGQFDVTESNLNIPGLEVNLVMWVETVDGAGSPIIGAGRYFDDGSAVGIEGNDNDGQDSSTYLLEFEGSNFEVRNTRTIPDSPEVGDKITLEVELVNSGIPGIANLEIKSVTNNQPPVFEGYITSEIIGKDQAQWVSIELEEFTDATTGMYYIVYDNETKDILFNGKDQGKTFNVKVAASGADGLSTGLIVVILIGIIAILAVVVVVISRRNRDDDLDDEFDYEYEDDKSYASIPQQTQTYAAPAAAVSPEMAEAMEKFSFWTQEEIQGYFDQGWSVQQLEEWLENQ